MRQSEATQHKVNLIIIDNKGERVGVLKVHYILLLCDFVFLNWSAKNVIFLLLGSISKQALILATERFRCRCLASGQDRCQEFVSGRFGCVLVLQL